MEIYHVLNRGVDKRKIFLDEEDYLRFIHDLYEFNDEEPAEKVYYYFNKYKYEDVGRHHIERKRRRKRIVDLLVFCLMPNHYHLLLVPKKPEYLTLFMKKLNGGYAKYFNEKYQRAGTLFERRFKRILIKREEHFIHIPYYIHCNPLDLEYPEWRNRELKNPREAIKFLEKYRWSSHLDYLGIKNFPSVTQREFLLNVFEGEKGYKEAIENWLKSFDLSEIKQWTLE
jgi:putative transposase